MLNEISNGFDKAVVKCKQKEWIAKNQIPLFNLLRFVDFLKMWHFFVKQKQLLHPTPFYAVEKEKCCVVKPHLIYKEFFILSFYIFMFRYDFVVISNSRPIN